MMPDNPVSLGRDASQAESDTCRSNRLVRKCGHHRRVKGSVILIGAVIQEDRGFPACTEVTAKAWLSHFLDSETRVDFPVASGPTKAITMPPALGILFFLFPF